MRWLGVVWLVACPLSALAAPLPESDALAPGRVGRVAADAGGHVRAWSERRPGAPFVVLNVEVDRVLRFAIDDHGNPDRVVVSPDGRFVAYVSAAGGVAGVWVARVADGARIALTNQGLPRSEGGPPPGWIPPPRGDDLRFDAGRLTWDGGAVALPEGWR